MNNTQCKAPQIPASDLSPIVEPLASFLCAAENPKMVLKLLLTELYSQIEQTNRAANAHVDVFLESRCSVSV